MSGSGHIHSCSHHCQIPACIKAQRDTLAARVKALEVELAATVRLIEAARILVNDAHAHPGVISVAQLADALNALETK